MDTNNWRPPQTEAQPPMDGGDWRSQLLPESRQRIVNKIMDTLKRHLPFSGQEGLQELKQIAIRFEEKIYSAATSQSDYLRKISLKMLTMESKSQNSLPNALPSNSASMSRNPQDSVASQTLQSQVQNQSQSVPLQMMPNQSQARQQLLSQNMQNNIASAGMQTTASLPNSMAPASSLAQNSMSNAPQNNNMQSISGISQNSMGNTMNQGVASNMFANSQRQMQGRQHTQQVGSQQQQQSQNSQQYMYQQQQLQQQLLKQKLQPGNNQQPIMQTPLQQQQQPPSQPQQNLLQGSQQPIMQNSSVMQPSMISGLQQNQQSSMQQPSQSVLHPHQQPGLRQQQQPQQTPSIQQQQTQLPQQSMMTSQALQQPQLVSQQPNAGNMQQNQLIPQQSNISDLQQQQQQRLLGQQNNLQNIPSQQQNNHQNMQQSQQQQQQQHLMGQQSNLSNMHQQQLSHQTHVGGLPQQQLMGTQSGNSNMQTNQQSVHMMQQPKAPVQQQNQNASLLPGVGQQAQPQSQSQPQLMSQLQSQPTQLQQQMGLQQTNSLQPNMQPRMQNQNSLLQQQNMIDQQKQLFQSQRGPPEGPSSSLDSTAQTTNATNAGDWQEEVYQKIKSMKDMYFADLNEMYQKISIKLQQQESLPQQTKIENIDKIRIFKAMLEKLMQILQITKNNILPTHKEKLQSFEKQIVGLLSSNRPRRPVHPMQPGQILPPQMQSMQQAQQSHSQISQAQPHEAGVNPQLQSMNLQGSVSTMQQSNVSTLQHGSVPSISAISSSQQSMPSSIQTNSNLDSGQGTAPSSMQQVAMASLQQNPVSVSQQPNISSLQSQSGVGMLQPNINSHQSSSNMLQNQHLKQQQEQQIMQNQHIKQQLQNRHFNQQLMQKQQLLQQQQQLHQVKQQQASQISAHQVPQLHQNDANEKIRQGLGLRQGAFPHHLSTAQRFAHQQLKPGASFPVSSPQVLQAASPQINQHSPQVDQQNLQQSIPKSGTPLQSANSPFVPSPSTPLAPSPMPGDAEKPAVSSLSNPANIGNHQSGAPAASQSLSIGTPGISPSPLFECAGPDGTHGTSGTVVSGKSSLTEQPLDRLLKAVKSISPKALNASVCDIGSVVSMIDRIAGSAPGNGSRATVGEDLVAMTKCRLQARTFLTQDGNSGTKKMRRYTSAMPLNVGETVGSMNDNFRQLVGAELSDLESTATSSVKKPRTEVNHALLEEIREINERLIDTVVAVSEEDSDPSVAASASEGSEGIIVKFSFSAVSLSPNLKSHYTSAQMSQIQPLKLLVPVNYPNCSPILLDKLPVDVRNENEDLSVKTKSRFSICLRSLSQPMSLKEIAKTWDKCARAVICEYAQQNGGGTFSSKYGTWENCSSTI